MKPWFYSQVNLRLVSAAFLLLFCAACQAQATPLSEPFSNQPSAAPSSIPASSTTPVRQSPVPATGPATQISSATPQPPTAAPSSTSAGVNLSHPSSITLARDLANPDDLALAPDGSIFVSETNSGSIIQVLPGGKIQTVLTGLDQPEGILFLPDGAFIIAEQGKNRLLRYDLTSHSLSTLIELKNKTSHPGLDGIALDAHDPADPSIIIPDSPNGRILRSSLDGKTITELAHGFARPVAAWVEKDGNVLVVDENNRSLTRLHPGGAPETLARNLPIPDDVIEDDAGHIYVNTLGDGDIHILSIDGRQDLILVKDLASPQGLVFDADRNLVIADSGHDRLMKIVIH